MDKKITSFVSKCKEEFGEKIYSIILVGSAARGKTVNGWSDVDISIIFKRNAGFDALQKMREMQKEFK